MDSAIKLYNISEAKYMNVRIVKSNERKELGCECVCLTTKIFGETGLSKVLGKMWLIL